ncbi:hypothetical protein [Micromonospora sp. U21]|uniref:hypothetical protein n=1 Tax=Micromonospora sp. U21 TaxID=2824899 RepID=UPI001B375FDE|nr:hypothetical protein [Micromonospora sp. U21]MBQ0900544.1 hypothetical protein [Micromonospora sp. U21]
MTDEQPRRVPAHRLTSGQREHLSLRPLWLCRTCGQPWPCGRAKLNLLAEYDGSPVSLFLYLAGCLHDAIDDLHKLNPTTTGTAADMFDRFLGWPARHTRSYQITTTDLAQTEETRP